MTPAIELRDAPTTHLSPVALAAILSGVGLVILGLLIGLVALLVRAVRTHKRLLADLEERGVGMTQSQQDANREAITKPRAVLRRNTVLPFNTKSGWGALPSVETIHPPKPPSFPPHYAPPKPAGFVAKPKRLSWPFSARRPSGRAIHMRKIRVPVLSTVIESPKPSPLVPVLSGPLGGESSASRKSQSRPSSDQSLLQHHPAFRNKAAPQETKPHKDSPRPVLLPRSQTAYLITSTETHTRPNRSKSVADVPERDSPGVMTRLSRPKLHARSSSTCSQSSGNVPDAGLPPLPLEVARIKSEARRRSLLSRSPTRLSISSFESAGSSILATQSSPIMRSGHARIQKVSKRDWKTSMVNGPRPLRDTLILHGKNQCSQGSIKSSAARFSSIDPSVPIDSQSEKRSSLLTNSSSLPSLRNLKTAEPVTLSKVSSPTCSPLTVRSLATPKRKSVSRVTPYGSPEDRRKRSSILQSVSGNQNVLIRQLSQASTQAPSTRSSNGNPFQWDPAPMSAGKPSALKGSPSARRGHKRHHCVRISLDPIILGPPSRSSSPMNDIREESPNTKSAIKTNIGLGFSSTRSLPRPPSTSTFAPDLKITATSIQASLSTNSPTLSMADYDHGPIGSPVGNRSPSTIPELSPQDKRRMSTGSPFSIPSFPSPCRDTSSLRDVFSPPPAFVLKQPSTEHGGDINCSDTFAGASSPFEMLLDIRSSPSQPCSNDEYDPERPYLIYQTPNNRPKKDLFSPFSTISEEPSAQSSRIATWDQLQLGDSPPCSPKTILPPTFPVQQNSSAYNLPIKNTTIPEESLETIDPSILSKQAFTSLNCPFDNRTGSIIGTSNANQNITIPTSPTSAKSMFEPLLEAAFPSSPPLAKGPESICSGNRARSTTALKFDLPSLSVQSSPSSMYSSPSPTSSPSPIPPCSPRPHHAQLPAPSLNFADMPTLSPSICGPRGSPPRTLRSSIQKLRRMNSDAEQGGRGERRYLRLGRQDSIALPGEESWLEELNVGEDEEEEAWDEEKGRRLVGDILNVWEEEDTILDLKGEDKTVKETSSPQTKVVQNEGQNVEEPKGLLVTSSPKQSSPAGDRSSSIWEDGEKFWASTPPHPHPPNSPDKPKQRFAPFSSSPNASPSRKRHFQVANDTPAQQEDFTDTDGKKKSQHCRDNPQGTKYRRRIVLGVGTPNVRIQVQPPSSGGGPAEGSSIYDGEGFLRI